MPYSKSLKNQIQIMPEDLTDNVLLFLAGEIPCAIPLLKIATVIRMIEITPVSECQKRLEDLFLEKKGFKGIAGCIKYHGDLIPVYYLNAFFGEEVKKPALTDSLIIVNTGLDGNSTLSALWAKSITGVYGRNDLFKIKESEIYSENNDKKEASEKFTAGNGTKLETADENKPECLKTVDSTLKAAYEKSKKIEKSEGYSNSGIFGFKIYSSDLGSFTIVIEDINEFILHGRCGRLSNFSHLNLNKDLKKMPIEISAESLEEKKASEDLFVITSPETDISLSVEESEKIKAILLERKKHIEQPYEDAQESETIEILRFRLNYWEYAFEMKYIREVLIYDKLTPVPGTPDYIPGIFALRGEIISLVDLRKFFSLHCRGLTDLNLVIIMTNGDITFGILADYITDIGTVPLHKLMAPDAGSPGISSKYIKGIVDNSLIVIDAEALLLDPDMIVDEK